MKDNALIEVEIDHRAVQLDEQPHLRLMENIFDDTPDTKGPARLIRCHPENESNFDYFNTKNLQIIE